MTEDGEGIVRQIHGGGVRQIAADPVLCAIWAFTKLN
jgi:hypothetical protein